MKDNLRRQYLVWHSGIFLNMLLSRTNDVYLCSCGCLGRHNGVDIKISIIYKNRKFIHFCLENPWILGYSNQVILSISASSSLTDLPHYAPFLRSYDLEGVSCFAGDHTQEEHPDTFILLVPWFVLRRVFCSSSIFGRQANDRRCRSTNTLSLGYRDR